MTVNSRVIKTFLSWSPGATDVPLMNGLRIQIMPSVDELSRARKHQFAAFLAAESLLVVWDDDPLHLVPRAQAIESELMELIWQRSEISDDEGEKNPEYFSGEVELDEESGQIEPEKRPVHLLNTYLVSIVIILITISLGAAWRQLAIEVSVDDSFARLGLVVLLPIQVFFSLFFAQVLVGCIAQMFGPVRQLTINSKYYSARPPTRLATVTLPHVVSVYSYRSVAVSR